MSLQDKMNVNAKPALNSLKTRVFDSYISKRSLKALKQLYFFVKNFVLLYSIF